MHAVFLQQKDYPAKFIEMNEFSSGKKRGEMNSKLKEIATEIEAVEGRRVELIQRRILAGGGECTKGIQYRPPTITVYL